MDSNLNQAAKRGLAVAVVMLLAAGCLSEREPNVGGGVVVDDAVTAAPVTPVAPEVPEPEPEPEPENGDDGVDEYHPDLGRPGFETPDMIMRCGDHQMSANLFDNRIELALDGGDYVLQRVDAEEGHMFSDGDFTLWNLGNDWAFLDESTDESYECFLAAIGG